MIIRKVDDIRKYCKSECKCDCYAVGCFHAGVDCARFDKLVDFPHEIKSEATNEKTTQ